MKNSTNNLNQRNNRKSFQCFQSFQQKKGYSKLQTGKNQNIKHDCHYDQNQYKNRNQKEEINKKSSTVLVKNQNYNHNKILNQNYYISNNSLSSLQHFKKITVLGQGQSAKVFLVQHKQTKSYYALKQIKKQFIFQSSSNHKQKQNILNQKAILQSIDHPFIIKSYSSFQDFKKLYFLIQYCPGGQLFNLLNKRSYNRFQQQNQCKFYAGQILLALQDLHKNGIIYRDLKLENIVIDKRGFIRLTDFGLSKKFSKFEGKQYKNQIPQTQHHRTNSICGTPQYLAPQIILKKPYSQSIDIWCFGCLIHQLFTGYPPFKKAQDEQNNLFLFKRIIEQQFQFLKEKKYKNKIINMMPSQQLQDLLKKMLIKQPQKRFKLEDIKNHSWFKDVNFQSFYFAKEGKKINLSSLSTTESIFAPNINMIKKNYGMVKSPLIKNSQSKTTFLTSAMTINELLKNPPFVPKLKSQTDTSHFDKQFTSIQVNSTYNLLVSQDKTKYDKIKQEDENQSEFLKIKKNKEYPLIQGFQFQRQILGDKNIN